MFKSVLLPIDPVHPASWEKALPMAEKLSAEGGTLHLLGILHGVGSPLVAQALPKGFEQKALQHLESTLQQFSDEQTGGRARVHVAEGHIAECILRSAEEIGADLIVMASHRPDELRSLFVGSHAGKVVRHAPMPVMVVR